MDEKEPLNRIERHQRQRRLEQALKRKGQPDAPGPTTANQENEAPAEKEATPEKSDEAAKREAAKRDRSNLHEEGAC